MKNAKESPQWNALAGETRSPPLDETGPAHANLVCGPVIVGFFPGSIFCHHPG